MMQWPFLFKSLLVREIFARTVENSQFVFTIVCSHLCYLFSLYTFISYFNPNIL